MEIPTWNMSEEISPDLLQQIWTRRAAQIAQAPEDETAGEQAELLVVQIGSDLYGLDVQGVYDIRLVDHITRVPRTPEWVAGLVNVRGHILSAIYIQRYFALAASHTDSDLPAPRFLVVLSVATMEIALLVDNVLAVEKLPTRYIEASQDLAGGIPSQYITGVTRHPKTDNFIIVLNLPAILSSRMLILNEKPRS